jgi:hypothetical protein
MPPLPDEDFQPMLWPRSSTNAQLTRVGHPKPLPCLHTHVSLLSALSHAQSTHAASCALLTSLVRAKQAMPAAARRQPLTTHPPATLGRITITPIAAGALVGAVWSPTQQLNPCLPLAHLTSRPSYLSPSQPKLHTIRPPAGRRIRPPSRVHRAQSREAPAAAAVAYSQ